MLARNPCSISALNWQHLIFRVLAFRRALCDVALQIPGWRVTRPLRSVKSAAARIREFNSGEIAFKTPGYWRSLRKEPFWKVTEVPQIGQLPYRLRM
jgi:hypothetical protein